MIQKPAVLLLITPFYTRHDFKYFKSSLFQIFMLILKGFWYLPKTAWLKRDVNLLFCFLNFLQIANSFSHEGDSLLLLCWKVSRFLTALSQSIKLNAEVQSNTWLSLPLTFYSILSFFIVFSCPIICLKLSIKI